MEFEWDEAKNRANREKHGISFEEAVLVFAGNYVRHAARTGPGGEVRWKILGPLKSGVIAAVIHTDRSGRVRIISARPAKRAERRIYDGTHRPHET